MKVTDVEGSMVKDETEEAKKGPLSGNGQSGTTSSKKNSTAHQSQTAGQVEVEQECGNASNPSGESTDTTEGTCQRANESSDQAALSTQPPSKRQTLIHSYESLEGSMKGSRSKAKDTSSSTSNGSGRRQKAAPPSTILVSQQGISAPTKGGPPRVITTTVASARAAGGASASSTKSRQGSNLRRGKWTVEEEAYVARVIQDFNSGFLDAPAGTTLRTYLSEKLRCDPMRITKKFTGDACIGKRVFHPAVRSPSNASAIDKAQAELDNLEKRWRRRLELQQRETAKKAAASAAAVTPGRAGTGRNGSFDGADLNGSRDENVVTRTASWLDRAKSVLDASAEAKSNGTPVVSGDLETEMNEVQRLIYEGPVIQQTSAGLPEMIDQAEQQARASSPQETEPADKRLRTAEDAEALVGFLRSVRASAMSGQEF